MYLEDEFRIEYLGYLAFVNQVLEATDLAEGGDDDFRVISIAEHDTRCFFALVTFVSIEVQRTWKDPESTDLQCLQVRAER